MADLSPGAIVDNRYKVLSRLGAGGMADVFLAEDQQLGRKVALKLLHRRFAADPDFVERFRRAGIPVVLLDRDLSPFPHRSPHDLVGIDNFAGGYLLAEHLLKLGVRRISFVTRPLSAATVQARIAGARAALTAHHHDADDDFVQIGDPTDLAFVRRAAALAAEDSRHIGDRLSELTEGVAIRVTQSARIAAWLHDQLPDAEMRKVLADE